MAARAVATLAAAMGILLMIVSGARAQSSPPSSSCTSALVSLSPCLNYISGNESTAPASCCAQLGKVVRSDPRCLCVALNADPASLGLSVNRTRALGLPDQCKVQTPPVSDCKQGGAAGPTPTSGAPAGEATPAAGSTGSKTTFENGAGVAPRGSAGFVVVAAALALFAAI